MLLLFLLFLLCLRQKAVYAQMSLAGPLISDVRRFLKEDNTGSLLFLLAGGKGAGKSSTLQSVVKGLVADGSIATPSTLTACLSSSSETPTGAIPVFRLCTLDFCTLQQETVVSDLQGAADPDMSRTVHPLTVAVVDDIGVLWNLCLMTGRVHVLKRVLSAVLRSPKCALITSVDSVSNVPRFLTELRQPLVYEVPRPTAQSIRRSLRTIGHTSPSLGVCSATGDADVPVTASLRSLTYGLCVARAAADIKGPDAWATVMHHSVSWLENIATSPTPVAQFPLYGLEDIQNRLELVISIFASTSARSGGKLMRAAPTTTGVLLHGPSGCGKTCLSRRMERMFHSIPFFFVQCTALFSKYLGESEERLRSIYRQARARAPAIVVLDDIDAIAQSRGAMQGGEGTGPKGGLDVSRRMIAGLLCELDGFTDNSGVLTIGSTNAPHVIDGALLRQGRLETALFVPPLSEDAARRMALPFFESFDGSERSKAALAELIGYRCSGSSPVGLKYLLRRILEAGIPTGSHRDGPCALTLPTEEAVEAALQDSSSALALPPYAFDGEGL